MENNDTRQVQSGFIYGHSYFWAQIGDGEAKRFPVSFYGSLETAREAMRLWITNTLSH